MKFFAPQKLSGKRRLTPEGFMIVEDVPLARVGTLIYGPGQTPIQPGPGGYVRITRDEATVFKDETMASIVGKPLTKGHPPVDVYPSNWKMLSGGVVLSARRGVGDLAEYMVGDIIITDKEMIDLVRKGTPEVSLGYDSNYVQTAPGEGIQKNIVYNHVAIVPRGRCGPRCSIGDEAYRSVDDMSTPAKKSPWQRLRELLGANGASIAPEVEAVIAEGEVQPALEEVVAAKVRDCMGEMHKTDDESYKRTVDERFTAMDARMKAIDEKLDKMVASKTKDEEAALAAKAEKDAAARATQDALEAALEDEAPAGKGEMARKAHDSEFLAESFQETLSLAEIIAPGMDLPKYDRGAQPVVTLGLIQETRARALDRAAQTDGSKQIITAMMNGKEMKVAEFKPDQVRSMFRTVAIARKEQVRNMQTDLNRGRKANGTGGVPVLSSPADFNRMAAEYYSRNNPAQHNTIV